MVTAKSYHGNISGQTNAKPIAEPIRNQGLAAIDSIIGTSVLSVFSLLITSFASLNASINHIR